MIPSPSKKVLVGHASIKMGSTTQADLPTASSGLKRNAVAIANYQNLPITSTGIFPAVTLLPATTAKISPRRSISSHDDAANY